MAFIAGYSQAVTFQKTGAGSATTLNITGWSNEEGVDVLEVTHSGTAGIAAAIAGVLTLTGNVTANTDAAAFPWSTAPGIKAGVKGVIALQTGGSTPWSIGVMITKVNHKSEVKGLVTYNFDYTIDAITQATPTYPT